MDVTECFEKGLLKKDKPDREKALKSIAMAKNKIESAKKLMKYKMYNICLVDIYSSMFHASRALLFRDGLKERSHYAVYIYLKEKYKDKIEQRFLNELDALRMERHDFFYGLDEIKVSEKEAVEGISMAEEFIRAVERVV